MHRPWVLFGILAESMLIVQTNVFALEATQLTQSEANLVTDAVSASDCSRHGIHGNAQSWHTSKTAEHVCTSKAILAEQVRSCLACLASTVYIVLWCELPLPLPANLLPKVPIFNPRGKTLWLMRHASLSSLPARIFHLCIGGEKADSQCHALHAV